MKSSLPWWAAGALLGVFADSVDTAACSNDAQWDMRFPAAGSQDVPLDVEFVLRGVGRDAATARLRAEGSEEEVPLVRRDLLRGHQDAFTILRPTSQLRPNTNYVLVLDPQAPYTWLVERTFRTGSAVSTVSLPAVSVSGIQAVDATEVSSCGSDNLACIGVEHAHIVEVTVRRRCDNVITAEQIFGPGDAVLVHYDERFAQSALCFEVRTRDLAGRHGPVTRLCPPPQEVATRSWRMNGGVRRCAGGRLLVNDVPVPFGDTPGNTENGSACTGSATDGGVVTDVGFASPRDSDTAGGCSTRPSSPSAAPWGVLAVAAALTIGRRRARRNAELGS